MFAIVLLLLHETKLFEMHDLVFTGQWLGERMLLVSIILSYYGAVEYTWDILGCETRED